MPDNDKTTITSTAVMTDPAEHHSHKKGLRTVAAVELLKGVLASLGLAAFIILMRRDVDLQDMALSIIEFLHIDPDRKIGQMFMEAADKAMYANMAVIVGTACVYCVLRFIEGYGLWRERVWAEWLAIVSGAIYFPLEIHALMEHATPLRWGVLITNIIVVAYIAYVRMSDIREAREHKRRIEQSRNA